MGYMIYFLIQPQPCLIYSRCNKFCSRIIVCFCSYVICVLCQAGVKHVILAVSYMSELLEREMIAQEQRVSVH